MKLVPTSGKKLCKIVEKIGFKKVHQVGSHTRYIHPDGRKLLFQFTVTKKLAGVFLMRYSSK